MMKAVPLWISVAGLLSPRALAALTSTESTVESATSTTSTSTSTSAAASCTASLITKLCSYPDPDLNFAVASDSRAHCWDYCNAHPPCSFVIFSAANPYLGTGSCWLYPGESYDASKGSTDCDNPNLSVYDQPVCAGSATTTTAGACAATATPSAIASVCGYPTPGDCFYDCTASSGAPDCLSQCVKADSCNYVVFNPGQSSHSPYAPGSCWMYPNGTYNAGSATTCSGSPEQFVYKNPCPKPSSSSSSRLSSVTEQSSGTGTTGTTLDSIASAAMATTTTSKNSASVGLSLTNPFGTVVAMLIYQAFQ